MIEAADDDKDSSRSDDIANRVCAVPNLSGWLWRDEACATHARMSALALLGVSAQSICQITTIAAERELTCLVSCCHRMPDVSRAHCRLVCRQGAQESLYTAIPRNYN